MQLRFVTYEHSNGVFTRSVHNYQFFQEIKNAFNSRASWWLYSHIENRHVCSSLVSLPTLDLATSMFFFTCKVKMETCARLSPAALEIIFSFSSWTLWELLHFACQSEVGGRGGGERQAGVFSSERHHYHQHFHDPLRCGS